jgi:long-subunit acyl-CoA synthetase (AMP-forming)
MENVASRLTRRSIVEQATSVVHHFFDRCAEHPEQHAFSVRYACDTHFHSYFEIIQKRNLMQQKRREEFWRRKTWGQYRHMVCRAARAMISFGLKPGDRICIFGKSATRCVLCDVMCVSCRW